MTTKEMERNALEKIRKIVDDLGEYSYIGAAMEGVWEVAMQNIDNDFACSMKDIIDARDKANEELRGRITELNNKVFEAERQLKVANDALNKTVAVSEDLRAKVETAERAAADLNDVIEGLKTDNADAESNVVSLECRLSEAEEEIENLKAENALLEQQKSELTESLHNAQGELSDCAFTETSLKEDIVHLKAKLYDLMVK